jgi:hypothetical protein
MLIKIPHVFINIVLFIIGLPQMDIKDLDLEEAQNLVLTRKTYNYYLPKRGSNVENLSRKGRHITTSFMQ